MDNELNYFFTDAGITIKHAATIDKKAKQQADTGHGLPASYYRKELNFGLLNRLHDVACYSANTAYAVEYLAVEKLIKDMVAAQIATASLKQ